MSRDTPEGMSRLTQKAETFPDCPNCSCVIAGTDKVDWRTEELGGFGYITNFEIKCPNCGNWFEIDVDTVFEDGGSA